MSSHAAIPTQPSQGLAAGLVQWWRTRTQPAARQLCLVETLALGPKRSVALLQLGGQRFLAGMGPDGVSTLLQVRPDSAGIEADL